MKIVSVEIHPWDLPMRSPYRSAQRLTTTAQNVLAVVVLDDGSTGYGESAPARYVTGETQESVVEAGRSFAAEAAGMSVDDAVAVLIRGLQNAPGARGMLETALADAAARAAGQPLYRYLGADDLLPAPVVTDLSLPILPPDEAGIRAKAAAVEGFRSIKIKVGSGDDIADVERVRAVASAAPGVTLRLDGNQGFAPEAAVRFIDSLIARSDIAARIELFEQPTPADDIAALRWVRERIAYPVYADESACSAAIAGELIESGACSGVVLKLAKTGLQETADTARAVISHGGRCLFGCMMESRIAIGAALHLAIAIGPVSMLFDLDGHLLVDDTETVSGGIKQEADRLTVAPTAPGLGLGASPARML